VRAGAGRNAVGLLLAVALLVGAGIVPAAAQGTARAGDVPPTRLLVTYAVPVDGQAEADVFAGATLAAAEHLEADDGRSAVQVLEFEDAADAARAARRLAGRADVLAVEPDAIIRTDTHVHEVLPLTTTASTATTSTSTSTSSSSSSSTTTTATSATSTTSATATATTSTTTADTTVMPATSWGVDNDGSALDGIPGRLGIDVGARVVAGRATGRNVVVAVIDSGVDISHPLLRDKMWRNPREIVNGADSDGNGFVDDIHGWNFVNQSANVFTSPTSDAHGTHVAGIIAGAPHAPSGFTSVAPGARIMSLKFIDNEGGRTSNAIAAIRYAVANGAHVINASWGGPDGSSPEALALRTVLAETPIPVVVAAGNLGKSLEVAPVYPASFGLPNVISVAAVDHTGSLAAFSSFSRNLVGVAAPGARILSVWPGSQLAISSGTSQAAPHVAGVLALALERHPGQDPTALAARVRATVRPIRGATATRSGGIVRAPALLDALGTSVPACPGVTSSTPTGFTDVPASNVHARAVACLVSSGVTKGVSSTRFGASDGLTRAQIATLVARALQRTGALPPPPAVGRFSDVSATNVHRDAIETLASLGIVRGATATTYAPSRTVTRAELAAVTARAAEYLAEGEIRAPGPGFTDTVGLPEAREIEKSAGLRIVNGTGDRIFKPSNPVRRDQAASMVTQLLDRLVQFGLSPTT
jgi:subtilisin family serine protease